MYDKRGQEQKAGGLLRVKICIYYYYFFIYYATKAAQ